MYFEDVYFLQIWVRGRLHTSRFKGKTGFIVLRARCFTLQCVLFVNERMSKQLMKYAESINKESIVDVRGVVNVPDQPVMSCTQSDVELHVVEVRFYRLLDVRMK